MPVVNGVTTVMATPEGYVVDFDNPQRTGVPEVYFVAGFGIVLSLLFTAQRLYVNAVVEKGLQVDDVFLILAMVTVYATSGFTLHMFAAGVGGVHLWEISIEKFKLFMLDVYIASFLYPICGTFAKMSLLTFFLRLSPQKWFRIATWATIAFVTAYTISIVVPLIFGCTPIRRGWDPTVEGKCVSIPALYIMIAAVNIFSDIILFILPLPMVFGLRISIQQKIGLVIIFGIGSITIITSIVRLCILVPMVSLSDATWVVGNASIWTQVEGYMMLICASLPTLRKFVRQVAPKLLGESRYGSNKSKSKETNQPPSRTLVPASQSRRDRTQYSQFDAEESNDTYIMGPVMGKSEHKITSGHSDEGTGWGDSDSEKGIVTGTSPKGIMTTTVVTVDVEYNDEEAGQKSSSN